MNDACHVTMRTALIWLTVYE